MGVHPSAPPPAPTPARRLLAVAAGTVLTLVALVGSGLLLNERLAPKATGAPGHALPLQATQTEIDRELAPLLAANPGKTGALLLPDGLDAYAARAMTAQKAGRSLDLQYYIWHDDLTGHLLVREVHAAAERGVRVRILLDDMNAAGRDPQWMALDAHPNIELRLYNPFRNRSGIERGLELVQRVFSVNHRMHNKAWITDGRVAIIGGRNIGEEYFAAAGTVNFRDLDLLLFGPAVEQASAIFDRFWNSSAVVPLAALHQSSAETLRGTIAGFDDESLQARAQPYLERVAASPSVRDYLQQQLRPVWTDRLQVVSDPPDKRSDDARDDWLVTSLLDMLRGARTKALLVSPYFVPGETGTEGLSALARDGVEVGVITNSLAANDVPAVHSGYARYRPALLRNGVRLHEIRARGRPESAGPLGSSGASLHTKAFVVDDARGFVGSFNLDPRSATLNTEMGVVFDDPALAAGVRAEYLRLSAPEYSYWVFLGREGEVRWLDRAGQRPVVLDSEPDAGVFRRAVAHALGWLPIESQL
ncbi:phospholipase D family protein [Luteimonas sp. 8-5]|uniref:phospholipase D family protein n=1 Tax=Luteimonas sp. 8-5 TaxID=3039387 RepID=UPI00243710F5|nr:phospholipase D family protein [Luteimonas sp. 8-5]MDG6347347.1 phospholipase D family protein [Luteimonas sp. 8-5]